MYTTYSVFTSGKSTLKKSTDQCCLLRFNSWGMFFNGSSTKTAEHATQRSTGVGIHKAVCNSNIHSTCVKPKCNDKNDETEGHTSTKNISTRDKERGLLISKYYFPPLTKTQKHFHECCFGCNCKLRECLVAQTCTQLETTNQQVFKTGEE